MKQHHGIPRSTTSRRASQIPLRTHGPDSVAFYLSGQLLTEDYYAANKLMKGFIGTANVDTNSRLCMASSVAGHRRAFGSDTVPGIYEDLDQADLLVLVGSNAAWCHPVLFQRMQAARETRGAKLIVIDPRRTATGEAGDMHLPSGTARIARCSAACWSIWPKWRDRSGFVEEHTEGLAGRWIAPGPSRRTLRRWLPRRDWAAPTSRRSTRWCRDAARRDLYSQGVNQSSQGTDKVNAIINCHLQQGVSARAWARSR